jgi:hypothetical protein
VKREGKGGGNSFGRSRFVQIKLPGFLDQRHNVPTNFSDMYTEMKNFSSRTVSAITHLNERGMTKKKSEYTWRQELEE